MAFIAVRPCRIDGVDYQPQEVVPDHLGSRGTMARGLVVPIPAPAAAAIQPGEGFDPNRHTVKDVLAYLDEHPDELEAVRAAEEAGYARKGVLGPISDRLAAEDTSGGEGGGNTSGDGDRVGSEGSTGTTDPASDDSPPPE